MVVTLGLRFLCCILLGFRVQGSGFRVQGLLLEVWVSHGVEEA